MMSTPQIQAHNSDSEDDDYVPPVEHQESSESSDDEPEPKRPRTSPQKDVELDEAQKKQARDALWSSFQASLSSAPSTSSSTPVEKMVKIEKRYQFAGETVVEVVEVSADSADAKKWPLYREKNDTKADTDAHATPSPELKTSTEVVPLPSSTSTATKPPAKRPGPRKSKITLAPIPTQKAKKLSTLDKSAMDWQAHVQGSEGSGLKDELEANRRGGGYLEKVEFLNRVEGRKEEVLEASKNSKRRRN